MKDTESKLSLAHRLRLRQAELKHRREQEALHKEILVAAEIERQIQDAYTWLLQVETAAAMRGSIPSRVASFHPTLLSKEAAGAATLDDVAHPEVQMARHQYKRLVAEHAQVAARVGAGVARAIRGHAANDNTEDEPQPKPTNGRGSRWG